MNQPLFMPHTTHKPALQPWMVLYLALLVAGLAVYLPGLTHEGLWLDEAYSAAIVKHPPLDIARFASYDVHPPLYYALLSGFVAVFGYSLFTLRLFSALGTLALVALGGGPIRRATSPAVGVLFSFLVIITPGIFALAQEVRMYSWAGFFITASAVYAYLAARDNQRRDWTLFGLASGAAAYTHYYALLAVGVIHALLLVWLWRRRQPLRRYLITTGLVALAYLPWLYPMARQMGRGITGFWVSEIALKTVWDTVLAPFSYKFNVPERPFHSYLAWGVTASGALVGGGLAWVRRRPETGLLLISLLTYMVSLGLVVAFSYVVRPILTTRYMLPLFGLIILPAAYALAALPRRIYTLGACILLLSLNFPLFFSMGREYFNGPQPQAVAYLAERVEPDDAFLHFAMLTTTPLAYYFPNHTHFLYNPNLDTTLGLPFYGQAVYQGYDVNALWHKHKRVWLIDCLLPECRKADEWVAAGYLKPVGEVWEFKSRFSWLGLKLVQVELAAPIPR